MFFELAILILIRYMLLIMSTLSKAYCIYAIVYSTELLKSFWVGNEDITVAAVELNAGANMHKQPMFV